MFVAVGLFCLLATSSCFARLLAAGDYHALMVQQDGSVYAWGGNKFLGLTSKSGKSFPTKMLGVSGATSVCAGGTYSCVIANGGSVLCGGKGKVKTFRPISSLSSGVSQISCGSSPYSSHTCVRLETGGVRCWGGDRYGQLATGSFARSRNSPVAMLGFENGGAKMVAAGGTHTCLLTLDGLSVHCAGTNRFGQLGNDGLGPGSFSTMNAIPALIGKVTAAVSCGVDHCCALHDGEGKLQCWGANYFGQLGVGTLLQSAWPVTPPLLAEAFVVDVFTPLDSTCALVQTAVGNTRELYCFGKNDGGRLGSGNSTLSDIVSEPQKFAIGANTVLEMVGGVDFSCISDQSRSVQCVGGNRQGQLGAGWANPSSTTLVSVVGLPATSSPTTLFPTKAPRFTRVPTKFPVRIIG